MMKSLKSCGPPLHRAVENGDVRTTKRLVSQGYDVNGRDHAGRTPLHCAANRSLVDVATVLLKWGADCNAQNTDGSTPLHMAALLGHYKLVHLLLRHGANPLVRNFFNERPLDVAMKSEVKRLLRSSIIEPDSDDSDDDDLAMMSTLRGNSRKKNMSDCDHVFPVLGVVSEHLTVLPTDSEPILQGETIALTPPPESNAFVQKSETEDVSKCEIMTTAQPERDVVKRLNCDYGTAMDTLVYSPPDIPAKKRRTPPKQHPQKGIRSIYKTSSSLFEDEAVDELSRQNGAQSLVASRTQISASDDDDDGKELCSFVDSDIVSFSDGLRSSAVDSPASSDYMDTLVIDLKPETLANGERLSLHPVSFADNENSRPSAVDSETERVVAMNCWYEDISDAEEDKMSSADGQAVLSTTAEWTRSAENRSDENISSDAAVHCSSISGQFKSPHDCPEVYESDVMTTEDHRRGNQSLEGDDMSYEMESDVDSVSATTLLFPPVLSPQTNCCLSSVVDWPDSLPELRRCDEVTPDTGALFDVITSRDDGRSVSISSVDSTANSPAVLLPHLTMEDDKDISAEVISADVDDRPMDDQPSHSQELQLSKTTTIQLSSEVDAAAQRCKASVSKLRPVSVRLIRLNESRVNDIISRLKNPSDSDRPDSSPAPTKIEDGTDFQTVKSDSLPSELAQPVLTCTDQFDESKASRLLATETSQKENTSKQVPESQETENEASVLSYADSFNRNCRGTKISTFTNPYRYYSALRKKTAKYYDKRVASATPLTSNCSVNLRKYAEACGVEAFTKLLSAKRCYPLHGDVALQSMRLDGAGVATDNEVAVNDKHKSRCCLKTSLIVESEMQELFEAQERERLELRCRHMQEQVNLAILAENELSREYQRTRHENYVTRSLSACAVLRINGAFSCACDFNETCSEQRPSPGDGNFSELVNKFTRLKVDMLQRQSHETEILHVTQQWQWKDEQTRSSRNIRNKIKTLVPRVSTVCLL